MMDLETQIQSLIISFVFGMYLSLIFNLIYKSFLKKIMEEIEALINRNLGFRKDIQPSLTYPNAGSVFKNGKDFTAWKEIKKLNLDNLQVGDARISKIHANIFVNDGVATFRDMYELIDKVKQTVYDKSNIILEEEIEIIKPQDIIPYQ